MADFKFTDLTAGAAGIDSGSLVCLSEYDGVSTYTSKKYTMTVFKDIMYDMEAEDTITFDSSGTNKTVIGDSNSTAELRFIGTDDEILLSTDGATLGEAYLDLLGGTNPYFELLATSNVGIFGDSADNSLRLYNNATPRVMMDATGLGFFGTSTAAKQTVTGSRGGNAALANLLTALANYGFITDSTSA